VTSGATGSSLRILYVGTLPPHRGGSAIMASQVLTGLARLGHEVEAIAPITEAAMASGDPFAAVNSDITAARFTMPYLDTSPDTPPSGDYTEREGREIGQLMTMSMNARLPDIVVIGRESFAPHVVGLARGWSVPSVLIFQGATTMGILSGTYPAARARRLLEHARLADAAVTSAEHMRRSLSELGVNGVDVIPNPVDLERFRPAAAAPAVRSGLGIDDHSIVVAHLSNLKSIKRALDFVRAAELAAAGADRLRFLVVGDGPDRDELERACAERGLAGRFAFPGWIDHKDMADVVSCTDVVVMPSAGEAQALVYLEAQACERTLIASDIPAAREVIEDGRTGMLFPTGDIDRLAELILTAARDAPLRRRLGREARRSLQRHRLPRVVSGYAELLQRVAAARRAPVSGSGRTRRVRP
jgi:glycosyltransferase involved in cell wall biosynthesis